MSVRQELDELKLNEVTGGAAAQQPTRIDQRTTGNKNMVNQSNVNGPNKMSIVQYNTVEGNSGNVKIGSPVHFDGTKGPLTINIG